MFELKINSIEISQVKPAVKDVVKLGVKDPLVKALQMVVDYCGMAGFAFDKKYQTIIQQYTGESDAEVMMNEVEQAVFEIWNGTHEAILRGEKNVWFQNGEKK